MKIKNYSRSVLVCAILFIHGISAEPIVIGPCPPISKQSQNNFIESYFFHLKALQKEEKWQEIISRGVKAIKQCQVNGDLLSEFSITDQLVSSYFRLGHYMTARIMGERLIQIADSLQKSEQSSEVVQEMVSELVIDSLYKLSASIRGLAGASQDENQQRELFIQARELMKRALADCSLYCPNNIGLKARVLFNAGAAECDDPQGDFSHGIAHYKDALELFTDLQEEDYRQRTLIRLGKAYFLMGDLEKSQAIITEVKQLELEIRTRMHLYYLEAQVIKGEGYFIEAKSCAEIGREIALQLHAEADLHRFNHLLYLLEEISHGSSI